MSLGKVAVLMGGPSAEREISLASGKMIAAHLPADRYEIVMLDPLALMAGNPRIGAEMRAVVVMVNEVVNVLVVVLVSSSVIAPVEVEHRPTVPEALVPEPTIS